MTSGPFYQMFCAPKWKYSRSLFWWHVISDPPVTRHMTDTRIVKDKLINHSHLYRWICKEPFYIACSKCSGASFFSFPTWLHLCLKIWDFAASGYVGTHQQCLTFLLRWNWGARPPFFMPKNIFTCTDWKGEHSLHQEVNQFEQAGNEKMFHRPHIPSNANIDS